MSTENNGGQGEQFFPDLSSFGYQITEELGNNRAGGRVTYLAEDRNNQQLVVIKDFQFAQVNSSWSGFDCYKQEIEVLQKLNHPLIPRYLNSFETATGFCLVQEYKAATNLNEFANLTVAEIRIIAIELLKILAYLQSLHPPVIHRDLKPENILIERAKDRGRIQVYLVDFGFARLAGDVTASSVVKGTLGFMPPEQIFNRELTCGSDLYSLGMTLICLLTRTKSADMGNLLDDNYCVDFSRVRDRAPEAFAVWLEQMVEPNHKNRFSNAQIALSSLNKPIASFSGNQNQVSINKNWSQQIAYFSFICVALIIFAQVISRASRINQIVNKANQDISAEKNNSFQSRSTELSRNQADSYRSFARTPEAIQENIQQLKTTRACKMCYLKGANLQGLDLSGVDLEQANLAEANLQGSNLRGVNLRSANLEKAQLQNSYLGYANFNYAKLGQASLRSANLENAQLEGANLGYAELEGANLRFANLQRAEINGANFRYAILRNAAISVYRGQNQRFKGAMLPDGTIHP